MPPIRLLMIDEHPLVRAGLQSVLAASSQIQLVGEGGDGKEALHLYRQLCPDIVIIDLNIERRNGLTVLRSLYAEFPKLCAIVWSADAKEETIYQALQVGAKAFLTKEMPSSLLLKAIQTVAAGSTYLPDPISSNLMGHIQSTPLTPKEREVLQLIAEGNSNEEIGDTLCIAVGTVKSHVIRILRKLKVADRTAAALEGIRRGLVDLA